MLRSLRQIAGKEDKHRKEYILSGINYKHPEMLSFEPLKRPTASSAASEASAEGGAGEGGAGEGRGGGGGGGEGVLEVEEVWKSSSHVAPILNTVGADTSRYYTASEARQLAIEYVQKEKLVKPGDASCVVLDAYLCDALFKGAIKKGSAYPTQIHFKDLGPQFLSRMQVRHHYCTVRCCPLPPLYCISRTLGPSPCPACRYFTAKGVLNIVMKQQSTVLPMHRRRTTG